MVAGGIHADRWEGYLEDIYRVLVPGGWCQMVEMSFISQSDNGTLTECGFLSIAAGAKILQRQQHIQQ